MNKKQRKNKQKKEKKNKCIIMVNYKTKSFVLLTSFISFSPSSFWKSSKYMTFHLKSTFT